ncbi:MAG: peptidylprolyl isomerase, partial [Boseongicola sp.]
VGDIVGPAPSPVGPALFRINGVLPAVNTSFDEARGELQVALAADRARRLIESQATFIDDLLAGGATLEEIAADTDMEGGKIDWFTGLGEGIAAYAAFQEAADTLTADDFAEVIALEDGGMFAMQLDNLLPQRPAPLVDMRRDVIADWEATQLEMQLRVQAEALLPQIQNGTDFAELALDAISEENLMRNDFVAGTPPAFLPRVFEIEPGEADIVDSVGAVLIVRLESIADPEDTAEITALYDGVQEQTSQALAQDIFDIFARDVQLRAKPQIDQRAVNAINANFQ